jgi:hypothetical protein
MIFLTTSVFVFLFYFIPLSHLIHNATERWAGFPIFNLRYVLVMSALYTGCYLLLIEKTFRIRTNRCLKGAHFH